jgi:hypothetical protein
MVWMLMTLIETAHSALREIFLAPAIGATHALQVAVPVSCIIVFAVAWLTSGWMGVPTRRQQLFVGGLWVFLAFACVVSINLALGTRWAQIISGYNSMHGAATLLTMAFMFVTPRLVARFDRAELLK